MGVPKENRRGSRYVAGQVRYNYNDDSIYPFESNPQVRGKAMRQRDLIDRMGDDADWEYYDGKTDKYYGQTDYGNRIANDRYGKRIR